MHPFTSCCMQLPVVTLVFIVIVFPSLLIRLAAKSACKILIFFAIFAHKQVILKIIRKKNHCAAAKIFVALIFAAAAVRSYASPPLPPPLPPLHCEWYARWLLLRLLVKELHCAAVSSTSCSRSVSVTASKSVSKITLCINVSMFFMCVYVKC